MWSNMEKNDVTNVAKLKVANIKQICKPGGGRRLVTTQLVAQLTTSSLDHSTQKRMRHLSRQRFTRVADSFVHIPSSRPMIKSCHVRFLIALVEDGKGLTLGSNS